MMHDNDSSLVVEFDLLLILSSYDERCRREVLAVICWLVAGWCHCIGSGLVALSMHCVCNCPPIDPSSWCLYVVFLSLPLWIRQMDAAR